MDKTFYFMGGLPRAGSTLLSTLLNQNPRFHSGPSSPVLGAMFALHDNFQGNELYTGYPKPDQVNEIVGSVIRHWYSDVEQEVIFDKNRAWTARVPFIEGYIKQEAKIIVPVRRVDEILASILTMIHRNTFKEGQPRINFVDATLIDSRYSVNTSSNDGNAANSNGCDKYMDTSKTVTDAAMFNTIKISSAQEGMGNSMIEIIIKNVNARIKSATEKRSISFFNGRVYCSSHHIRYFRRFTCVVNLVSNLKK